MFHSYECSAQHLESGGGGVKSTDQVLANSALEAHARGCETEDTIQ